jgi:hypothetical protein
MRGRNSSQVTPGHTFVAISDILCELIYGLKNSVMCFLVTRMSMSSALDQLRLSRACIAVFCLSNSHVFTYVHRKQLTEKIRGK